MKLRPRTVVRYYQPYRSRYSSSIKRSPKSAKQKLRMSTSGENNSIEKELADNKAKVDSLSGELDELRRMMAQMMSKLDNFTSQQAIAALTSPTQAKPRTSLFTDQTNSQQPTISVDQLRIQHYNNMPAPTFEGDCSKAIMWLVDYKEVAAINKWSEDDRLNYVCQALKGAGKAWFRSIWFHNKPGSWAEFEEQFKKAFLGNRGDTLRARLRKFKQTRDMDLLTYYHKAMELCTMVDAKMDEQERIEQIIDNMLPECQSSIGLTNPATLIELQQTIRLYIKYQANQHNKHEPSKVNKKPTEERTNRDNPKTRKEDFWCVKCGKQGHYPNDCSSPQSSEVVKRRREEWRANPPFKKSPRNHPADRIRSVMAEESQGGATSSDNGSEIQYEEPPISALTHPIGSIQSVKGMDDHKKRTSSINCIINGKAIDVIIDTGATLTVMPYQFVVTTKTPLYRWRGSKLRLANGGLLLPLGWCQANINYDDRTVTIAAVVLKEAPDILLGEDYINKAGLVISYHDKIITYSDKFQAMARKKLQATAELVSIETQTSEPTELLGVKFADEDMSSTNCASEFYIEHFDGIQRACRLIADHSENPPEESERLIKSQRDILIPPQTKARIEAETTGKESSSPLWIEANPNGAIKVVPGVTRKSKHVVDIVNVTSEPIQIYKRQVLARAVPLDYETPIESQVKAELTPEQDGQLQSILDEYDELFVTQNENIGIVPFIRHVIDTGTEQPIRSKPYRVSYHEQQVIRKLVDEMLEAGIIRPSRSHWASPVVLVKKKGTTDLRFCVDYRKLNRITKIDPYPIPNMESVLETLSGNNWFSKLDVKSMYWQVLMDKDSVEKTAFVVHCGHYEFNVMPFGLVAAPMTAMRVMNEVIKDITSTTFVFYDDILVYTPTFEAHLAALKKLFEKLKLANITLNRKKCELMMKSVTYLGHIITPDGILPDPAKVKSIEAFQTPRNITEARSFIGMCNFFRRYIRDFSTIAKPIHETIKSKQVFEWTEAAQQAMDTLKVKLTSPPLLVHYDQNGQPIVRCDASGFGLGAVLMQKSSEPSKNGVVAYTSRTLSQSERNYATTHKECLAVIHAVKQWRHYLYGKHFLIITDHHALCWLMKTKDHNAQLTRWSLILQEYDFTIQHESGRIHNDADCLSRNPLPATGGHEDESNVPTWPICGLRQQRRAEKLKAKHQDIIMPTFDVAKEQRSDDYYLNIMKILEDPNSKRKDRRRFKHFIIKDGQLYRRSKQHKDRYLLAIPKSMVEYILKEAHDAPVSGHFGVKRTYETIRTRFYWRTIDQDVKRYVKSCDKCQKKKADSRPREGLMMPMPIPARPFEIVGIDLMGPLPLSTGKKSHVLVITDYLTKYVIASTMRKTTSQRIAEHLKQLLFFKHGVPKTIITDNGANLTSYELRSLFDSLQIKHKTTSPYRPQTNGQTERYNRVLGTQLAIFAGEKPESWDEYLDALVFAYNTTVHANHLQTPFYLVHGREAMKPMDLAVAKPLQVNEANPNERSAIDVLNAAREFARRLIRSSQLRAKRRYDSGRVLPNYKVNDLVLKKQPPNKTSHMKKFTFIWAGPYRVVAKLNDINYQLMLEEDPDEQHIVHVTQIKPYHQRGAERLAEETGNESAQDTDTELDDEQEADEYDYMKQFEDASQVLRVPRSLIGKSFERPTDLNIRASNKSGCSESPRRSANVASEFAS